MYTVLVCTFGMHTSVCTPSDVIYVLSLSQSLNHAITRNHSQQSLATITRNNHSQQSLSITPCVVQHLSLSLYLPRLSNIITYPSSNSSCFCTHKHIAFILCGSNTFALNNKILKSLILFKIGIFFVLVIYGPNAPMFHS